MTDVPPHDRPHDRPHDVPTGPLTSTELWRRPWYLVPDDEVGGWAIATADRPTSMIDPTTTRDRVLAWVVWEEHGRWLVDQHNLTWDEGP